MDAADAAASPDPRTKNAGPRVQEVVAKAADAHRAVNEAKAQVRQAAIAGGKGAAKGMFAPVKKFSRGLWLEVTGTFFAVVAVFIVQGAWKLRGAWAGGSGLAGDRGRLVLHVALFALFAYFAVSSFVRARRG